MLLSMTGQGDGAFEQDHVRAMAEIRSVNSRYFKLNIRLTDGLAGIEPKAEALIRKTLRRGSVYLDLRLDGVEPNEYRVNTEILQAYRDQLSELPDASFSLDTLLTLPGVVEEQRTEQFDVDQVWAIVQPAIKAALDRMAQMRASEGAAMKDDLLGNCERIRKVLDEIETKAPNAAAAYSDRLTERINKLLAKHDISVESSDLVREVGLFAERCDISEEVVRLGTHLEHFLNVCELPESNGRKLDFLTQEMFRETNTIGSKANDAAISQDVVEIKSMIERMREMIQNIE